MQTEVVRWESPGERPGHFPYRLHAKRLARVVISENKKSEMMKNGT